MRFTTAIAATTLATLVTAMPGGGGPTKTVTVTAQPTATSVSQCNTGDIQCCNSVQSASAGGLVSLLLGLLGLNIVGTNVLVGLTCSPLSIIGLGSGADCNAQPVCCSNNNFSGLISIGCSPINLGL